MSDGKWKRFRMRLGNFADFIFGKMLLAWQLTIESKVGHAQLTNAEECDVQYSQYLCNSPFTKLPVVLMCSCEHHMAVTWLYCTVIY